MPKKALKLIVELNIHSVTCPGVWLCPKGKVALRICILRSAVKSSQVAPIFPLSFQEKFVFEKTFLDIHDLMELQQHLHKETLYAELIQWPDKNLGVTLATFETTLRELLFPTLIEKTKISSFHVDLLMSPVHLFPGILAPKIEVSTKTSIEEVVKPADSLTKKPITDIIPKMLNSKSIITSKNQRCIARQHKVCHSRDSSENLCGHTQRARHKKDVRAPFVVRHVDDNIFDNILSRKDCILPKSTKQKVWGSGNASPCQPTQRCTSVQTKHANLHYETLTEPDSDEMYQLSDISDISGNDYKPSNFREHVPGKCSVCDEYKTYFSKKGSKCDSCVVCGNSCPSNNNVQGSDNCHCGCQLHSKSTTDLSKTLTREIHNRVTDASDCHRNYPLIKRKELHLPFKRACNYPKLYSASTGLHDDLWLGISKPSSREEFYRCLQNFYRDLFMRVKCQVPCETNVN